MFVYAIVYSELAIFACFGLTQFFQFLRFDIWGRGDGGGGSGQAFEAAYIVQSLVGPYTRPHGRSPSTVACMMLLFVLSLH
jgi:hypothetical protein